MVNSVQSLILQLMECTSFSDVDGKIIARDLRTSTHLWSSVMTGSKASCIFPLRDIPQNQWNVDTLYILSSSQDDIALETMAKSWNPSRIYWMPADEAGKYLRTFPFHHRVLCLRWQ